jgi:putative ATP-dependent endonuclease of OLD family
LELVRHVILPPLRDARYTLGSASGTRIVTLLEHFLVPEEEEEFLDHVKRGQQPHRVVSAVNSEIATALGALTRGVRPQTASLDFTTESVSDVARDLRFRLADAGIPLEDIRSSGLGYSNLLYIATVVVELAKSRDADLTLFLVEEPEAHLHPQLQMLVLDFLLAESRKSASQPVIPGQPEGRIQVVVTTHSPNLTSWVSPEHLVVVRTAREVIADRPVHQTVAIPVARLGLSTGALAKIRRYLDVTRSAILFGNRVVLVEGIAEAILLPVIAQRVTLRGDPEAFQRFRGAVLVPIDGVDFRPYVEILLKPHNGATIADRVVVVTDADPQVSGNRAADLAELAVTFGSSAKLSVFTNSVTLEHELFQAGNASALKKVFLDLHPRSATAWADEVEGIDGGADALIRLFDRKRVRKGDFAQRLAGLIDVGEPFSVPPYLDLAIRRLSEADAADG